MQADAGLASATDGCGALTPPATGQVSDCWPGREHQGRSWPQLGNRRRVLGLLVLGPTGTGSAGGLCLAWLSGPVRGLPGGRPSARGPTKSACLPAKFHVQPGCQVLRGGHVPRMRENSYKVNRESLFSSSRHGPSVSAIMTKQDKARRQRNRPSSFHLLRDSGNRHMGG
jgi:hypothetical protein